MKGTSTQRDGIESATEMRKHFLEAPCQSNAFFIAERCAVYAGFEQVVQSSERAVSARITFS